MDLKTYKKIHPVKYYRDYLEHNIRPDGREIADLRPLAINFGSIHSADGSAIVKIGNTTVVCGIKAELAPPKALEPEMGFLVPNIEISPLASPKYRPGPPSEEAQVYSCSLADSILNSGCVNLKDLCISKEKLVWALFCDLVCLDHDGCVFDASVIALVAALHTLKLPQIKYNPDTDEREILEDEERIPLKVSSIPVTTSFAVFNGQIIADPTAEEESLATSTITISICDSTLSYIQKSGGDPLEQNLLDQCIENAMKREKSVRALVKKLTKNSNKTC
ncbi:exosome complex component RRP43-like [Uranotaenia lowii]|uniref:exosome complex component RRP43-like n=1 Tax=Uranotaenia lowii TaxID=190385 RepID=UPI00247A7E99|nr:exosome complex component RRP43-like [Uranotaenia lowii]XP_055599019.1 exosome complex component RRP43-like [Uranotaenia lowii]